MNDCSLAMVVTKDTNIEKVYSMFQVKVNFASFLHS